MSDSEKCSEARIEILGQVIYYPRTIWGMLSVISIFASVCIIFWIVAVKANPQNLKAATSYFSIARSTSEKTDPIEGRYLIQFWTPSVKTKESKDFAAWEKVDTNEQLNKFADHLLQDRRVRGYRRYEVTGQGIAMRRDGAWWVMTVDDDYAVVDLVKAYQEFWKNETSIYIEVLRSGTSKYVK